MSTTASQEASFTSVDEALDTAPTAPTAPTALGGHLDRNLLARLVAALVTDQHATPATPRCDCEQHPARRPAPMPGALFSTGALPGLPATVGTASTSRATASPGGCGPVPPGLTVGAVARRDTGSLPNPVTSWPRERGIT